MFWRRMLFYISVFAMLMLLAGCGSDEWTGEISENPESSEEYGEFEPQYRAYLKQWDRVIERDEFDVKLYKPYKYVVSTIVDPHLDYDRIVEPIDPSSYLPNAEWYNNAKKAIAFLRKYRLEFAVPPEGGLSYTDFAREGVAESLVLNFFSGGDRENIPELDLMINPDGTVIIRDRDGAGILCSKTKIDFGRFTELDFKDGTLMTIQQGKYMFLVEAWTRIIEKGELKVKLYKPYRLYIERLKGSGFSDLYTPTQEWYDNAEKAIDFFKQYDLEFESYDYYTSSSNTFFGGSFDTLVLNFYSGDGENIPELLVNIDPSGIVVIEGKNADGERMSLHSKTRVDFDAFAGLFWDESVYITYEMRVDELSGAWNRLINQHFDAKLYNPHTLVSETLLSQPIEYFKPTQEWYDNAQKAIEFLRAYSLSFKTILTNSFVSPDAVVLNFYSGGDEENELEIRVFIEPDGRVIIEERMGECGTLRMESNAKVDVERFLDLFPATTQQ